ncbi:DUF2796 domain-containing protein [Pseudomonas sp. NCCP-436]|uniref:DUF2796 domain-containing protein n=1 Tax=Pseudomonas sp. NCCP-436 TaxID=2842481 RepID=UPI001C8137D8|nr:DUF2796 domain-containing protein [Pseudomonas sp. NCCP-436]GIZ11684.1 hypothetical protein NCCP436_11000 [Pseudomonas sp. NCCP-436]
MRHLLLALPFVWLPLIAQAHDHAHEHAEHGSLGAHEHGVANLNIALDGKQLEVQLESPAMNLIGFEHAARSEADKAQLENARRELEKPLTLFALSSNNCRNTRIELHSPLFYEGVHEHHHSHGHDDEHSEIHAHYQFECTNELKQLSLAELFKRFPATEKVQVQLIGPAGQQGLILTPSQPRLSF